MNFAEVRFWELLIAGLGLILLLRWLLHAVRPACLGWFDKITLLGLSAFLLACVSWVTFLIFILVAAGTYLCLAWVLRREQRHQNKYLFVLIPLQLLPLFYYKYADFACNGVLNLDFDGLRHLIIPVGISFYTFQIIGFVLDTLHYRKPLPKFVDFMNFAGFFPQIVAGPIERRDHLLPQMESFRYQWSAMRINEGAGWIVLGFFFKGCMADNLAIFFDGSSSSNAYLIWLANVVFGLRIYYDFAGYSLIALGLGRCLGISLTLNFASPYCSTSIVEFWRRWHITLSQWFRDYLYVPLGGGRVKFWAFNVLLVFVVSGIWHGAGWNFLVWGGMHGLFLVLNRIAHKKFKFPSAAAWVLTMLGSFMAWSAFYESNTPKLMAKLGAMLNPQAYSLTAAREALGHFQVTDLFVLSCLLLLAAAVHVLEWRSLAREEKPYRLLLHPWILTVLIVLTLLLAPARHNAFIYFAF